MQKLFMAITTLSLWRFYFSWLFNFNWNLCAGFQRVLFTLPPAHYLWPRVSLAKKERKSVANCWKFRNLHGQFARSI